MPNPIPLVVIDGGGTGSRLRAIDANGGILAETSCGPSNLTYGVDEAWHNLREGLAKLSDEVGLPVAGTRLWCGFAGGRSPTRQAAFRAANPVAAAEITIVTDGFASLIGAHQGAPGIVLAVGTGVAAFALTRDGHVVSSSAWGYKIGDEGSGGWIGNRAVSLLARHLDGRLREESALFSQLQQVVGEDFDAIQLWLSEADTTAFAALAPLVLQAAEAGDTIANRLLTQATQELVVAVQAVDAGQPIALLGGLAQVMEPRLRQDFPSRIIPAKGNALDGLQIIAARGWRDETRVTFEIAS